MADIDKIKVGSTTYDIRDGNAVRSVNGKTIDQYGSVSITGGDINTSSSDTTKLSAKISSLNTSIGKCEVYVITISNLTSTNSSITYTYPSSGTDSKIESDMVCINSTLSNPTAQNGDWTVTTSSGSLTITGAFTPNETTNITLYMMKSR